VNLVEVIITKHALLRLIERKPRKYKKFNAKIVENIIQNVIENGKIVPRSENEIRISTSNYTLGCSISGNRIIVKTVMKTSEMTESFRKLVKKRGVKSNWKAIVTNTDKIEKWLEDLEKLENICSICGICSEVRLVVKCNILNAGVCADCCVIVGGPYLKSCKSCLLGKEFWRSYYALPKIKEVPYIL